MMTRIHAVAATLALVTITLFFSASLIVEVFGDKQALVSVKQWIVYGLFVLVPLMIITGLSGKAVIGARKGKLIATKMKRMVIVAANGLLILVPCAILLQRMAVAGTFDSTFYGIQAIEFVAGAVNIGLMGLNMRDGLLLTGRLKKRRGERLRPAEGLDKGRVNY
jgi:hypothetical protein